MFALERQHRCAIHRMHQTGCFNLDVLDARIQNPEIGQRMQNPEIGQRMHNLEIGQRILNL